MQNFENPSRTSSNISINHNVGNAHDLLFCVKCNLHEDVDHRLLSYSKVSPVAYLAFLLGPIAALIVLAITSKNHNFEIPYCRQCWNRYRTASWLSGFSIVIFCFSLGLGFYLMVSFNSGYWFWPPPIFATVLMAYLLYLKQTTFPKVLNISRSSITIDAGVYGEVTYSYYPKISRMK